MSKLTKSKKYTGVYYRQKENGDVVYYFTYKDEAKTVFHKVGLKSQKITEKYVAEKRSETVVSLKNNEIPNVLKNKKKYIVRFKEAADFYFSNCNARTNEKRKKLYKLRLEPEFGKKNINTINPMHILNFRNKYIGKYAPHTINCYIELISTIFNFYIKHKDRRLQNPTTQIDKLKVNNARKRILSKDEIEIIFDELENDFMLSLFCSLCLCTGARKSTILNYKIKDIDMAHKTINSFDFKNQTSYISFMDERTFNFLEIRLSHIQYDSNPNTPLIYVDGISDLSRWMNRQLKPVFDIFNEGLASNDTQNRVVIHTFRHTLLSHLGMKGVNSQLLQKISNHKDSKMVDRYVKLNKNTGMKEINEVWK